MLVLAGAAAWGCARPATRPKPAPGPAEAIASGVEAPDESISGATDNAPTPPCEVRNGRAEPAAYVDACRLLAQGPPEGPPPLPPASPDWRPAQFERGTLFMPPQGWLIAGKSPDEARLMAVELSDPERTANVSCSVDDWFSVTRAEVIEMGDTDGMPGSIARRDLTVAGHPVLEQRYTIDSGDGIVVYPRLERWHAFGDDATVASCTGNGRHGFEAREPLLTRILDTYQPPVSADAGPSMPRMCREFDGPTHHADGDTRPVALAPIVRTADGFRIHWTLDMPMECGAWFHVVPLGGGPPAHAYVDFVEKQAGRYRIGARLPAEPHRRIAPEPGRPTGIPTDAVVIFDDIEQFGVRRRPAKLPADLDAPGEVLAVVDLQREDDGTDADLVFIRVQGDEDTCLRLYRRDLDGAWTPDETRCW